MRVTPTGSRRVKKWPHEQSELSSIARPSLGTVELVAGQKATPSARQAASLLVSVSGTLWPETVCGSVAASRSLREF